MALIFLCGVVRWITEMEKLFISGLIEFYKKKVLSEKYRNWLQIYDGMNAPIDVHCQCTCTSINSIKTDARIISFLFWLIEMNIIRINQIK